MTSQRFSERIARTDRRTSNRRGIKKRGILPSFGDIVLPIVSIAAVVLLFIAGRQFFVKGVQTPPDVTSTRAYADSPSLVAEREREEERRREREQEREISEQILQASQPEPEETAEPALTEIAPPVASVPPIAQPVNTATAPAPAKTAQTTQAAQTPAKTPAQNSSSASTGLKNNIPMNKQWRVQVGAFGNRAGAQDAVKKINNAGYQAEIYSNPASKYIKVWVKGGTEKSTAEKVAEAMQKLGFKGSFVFPPMSTK